MNLPTLARLRQLLFGDHRTRPAALREAGFADEAEATTWARSLAVDTGKDATSELEIMQTIRRARPDITLATARYIARQTITRQTTTRS